jgi:hypothetical protein
MPVAVCVVSEDAVLLYAAVEGGMCVSKKLLILCCYRTSVTRTQNLVQQSTHAVVVC